MIGGNNIVLNQTIKYEEVLTVADIREQLDAFPNDRLVIELLDELLLRSKLEKGLREADEGRGLSPEEFNRQLNDWYKSHTTGIGSTDHQHHLNPSHALQR